MPREKASRKYQLTINNPLEHGLSHDVIKTTIGSFTGCLYWCLCDEVGESGTPHTHVYLVFKNAVMFSTVHSRFYGAHIEPAKGTNPQNRDYVRKEGKWAEDAKHETNLPDTFEESGELPEDIGKRESQSEAILAELEANVPVLDIVREYPTAMSKLRQMNELAQAIRQEKHKDEFRRLTVTYIWGETAVGKTRSVMEKHGYSNVYRVTNYAHPFDGYAGQDVILFDEFRSSLPIGDMLNYLDGYPLMLPCRYADKAACFTQVYVISNIPIEQQYINIQQEQPKTWAAFLRRFQSVYQMCPPSADAPDGLPF